jgi:hypothetical protein
MYAARRLPASLRFLTSVVCCVVCSQQVVVTGGFESMSNVPFYLPKVRQGLGYGHGQVLDGLVVDGLADAYDNQPMGVCAEVCASTYGFTRQQQDEYALESFRRANESIKVRPSHASALLCSALLCSARRALLASARLLLRPAVSRLTDVCPVRAFACVCVRLRAFACVCVRLRAFACVCVRLRAVCSSAVSRTRLWR